MASLTHSLPALAAHICPAPIRAGTVCDAAQVLGGLRISQAAVYSGEIASPGVRRRFPFELPLWKPSPGMSCVGGPLTWGFPQRGSRTT
jgi:hypothetical protein